MEQALPCSINFFSRVTFWRKLVFSEKQYSALNTFFGELPFSAATNSKDVIFYSSYLFRRATFSQHTLSEELLFHSCASFSQLHFQFISCVTSVKWPQYQLSTFNPKTGFFEGSFFWEGGGQFNALSVFQEKLI